MLDRRSGLDAAPRVGLGRSPRGGQRWAPGLPRVTCPSPCGGPCALTAPGRAPKRRISSGGGGMGLPVRPAVQGPQRPGALDWGGFGQLGGPEMLVRVVKTKAGPVPGVPTGCWPLDSVLGAPLQWVHRDLTPGPSTALPEAALLLRFQVPGRRMPEPSALGWACDTESS